MRLTALAVVLAAAAAWAGIPAAAAGDQDPSLKTVLARAADYTAGYLEALSAIVAEERYVQRTGPDAGGRPPLPGSPAEPTERVLRSDFIVVPGLGAGSPWLGVREVLEVDGRAVEGEHGRLEALMREGGGGTAGRLRALADAQARFNLGDLYRSINVPTLALEFLLRDRQPRFKFTRSHDAEWRGTRVWTIAFSERSHPTLIRTPDGRDVVSEGTFWIEPASGAALRTELRAGGDSRRGLRALILVSYARHERFDMLLPDDMNELYLTRRTRIEGHATYGKFRRFETDVRIK